MQKLLTALGDLLFPPTANAQRLRTVTPAMLQHCYTPGRYGSCQYLTHYADPLVQAMILENKFHHSQHAAKLLGNLVHTWHNDEFQPLLYVPIPLGKKRERQRGHNQVTTLLRAAPTTLTVDTTLLARTNETPPQTELPRAKRQRNMRGVFTYTGGNKASGFPAGTQVVLVDDVITTGATMQAAYAALAPQLPAHVSIRCLALAH